MTTATGTALRVTRRAGRAPARARATAIAAAAVTAPTTARGTLQGLAWVKELRLLGLPPLLVQVLALLLLACALERMPLQQPPGQPLLLLEGLQHGLGRLNGAALLVRALLQGAAATAAVSAEW